MKQFYKNHEVTLNNNSIETIDGLEIFAGNKLGVLVKFNQNLAIYKLTTYLSRTEVEYTGVDRHNGKLISFGSMPTKKLLSTFTDFNGGYDYSLPFTVVDENKVANKFN